MCASIYKKGANMLNLRILRGKKSQIKVAEDIGITQRTYSNYESGRRQPDPETLLKIADYFNVSVDYLLGREPIQFLNFRTAHKDCIVVYNHSGDIRKYPFKMEDIEHIYNICEALTKDYKKLEY